MIHAKLISGGNYQQRQKIIAEIIKKTSGLNSSSPHPDLITLESATSISIKQIRELKNRLSLKPYSAPCKIAVIAQAEKMTLPAQNALLKTLEEPGSKTILILGAAKKDSLLGTIVSRCQIISLPQQEEFSIDESKLTQYRLLTKKILKARVGERLKEAAFLAKDKQTATEFMQIELFILREFLLQKPTTSTIYNIRQAQKTVRLLQANVNTTLAISNFFLCLS